MPYLLFLKKAAEFEIVACCKLYVMWYGLSGLCLLENSKTHVFSKEDLIFMEF